MIKRILQYHVIIIIICAQIGCGQNPETNQIAEQLDIFAENLINREINENKLDLTEDIRRILKKNGHDLVELTMTAQISREIVIILESKRKKLVVKPGYESGAHNSVEWNRADYFGEDGDFIVYEYRANFTSKGQEYELHLISKK